MFADDIEAHSTQVPGVTTPVSGGEVASVLHRVGSVGQPQRLLLSASPNSLPADSLAQAVITATIVDAQGHTISTDNRTLVSFSALSGSALIDGPLAAQAQSGRAETSLRANTNTDTVRIRAIASGLLPDTIAVALVPSPTAQIDLSAIPQSILLEAGDSSDLIAILRDAYGNPTLSSERVQFSLTGPGIFVDGLSSITATEGRATTHVRATTPGTLHVTVAVNSIQADIDI
ncbi:MAG: invasin domain 3-containing protein [Candidatus Latescibacterota bacterium]